MLIKGYCYPLNVPRHQRQSYKSVADRTYFTHIKERIEITKNTDKLRRKKANKGYKKKTAEPGWAWLSL